MREEKVINIENIKVHRLQVKNEGILLATVELEYLGFIIKGFRVTRSDKLDRDTSDYVWIQAPAVNAGGKWIELVRINDKEIWQQVKVKIFKEYQIANDKYYRQKLGEQAPTPAVSMTQESDVEPEVNVDDIKF